MRKAERRPAGFSKRRKIAITMYRDEWIFLSFFLIANEMKFERRRSNRAFWREIARRLAAIRLRLVTATNQPGV